jgi:hypothetical protein
MADTFVETRERIRWTSDRSAVTVAGTGLTSVAVIPVGGRTLLCFHFEVDTQAVDDVQVYAKAHPDATAADITPTSATWATPTTPSRRILHSSVYTTTTGAYVDGDLNTVATTESGYLEVDVTGLYEVEIKMSAGADSAAVTPRWSLT